MTQKEGYEFAEEGGTNDTPGQTSWSMLESTVLDARRAIEIGIENTRNLLVDHDAMLGRTIRKNRVFAESMESDIRIMTEALLALSEPNGCSYGSSGARHDETSTP